MRVGVICAATEYQGTWQSAAFHVIMEKVRRNAKQVLEEMTTREILPREAAVDLAIERLRNCMSYRR
jgi:glutamate dehydrogenase (NAD(P)+)